MTFIGNVIAALAQRGVELSVDGEKLVSRAKPGAIDAETASLIRSRKAEFIAFLQRGEPADGYVDAAAFWRVQLDCAPAAHALPLDRPRPRARSAQRTLFEQRLEPLQLAQLHALAARFDTDPGCILRSALAITVAYWSRSDDVIVGIGRDSGRGPLPLRVAVQPDAQLTQILEQCAARSRAAILHGALTLDELADLVLIEASNACAPLCQIVLWEGDDPSAQDFAPFDICVVAAVEGDTLALRWHIDAALFDDATMAGMMESCLQVLRQLASDPDVVTASLHLASADDLRRQQAWNATAVPYADRVCLHTLVEQQAASTPERIALVCGDVALTYSQVNGKANALVAQLIALGVIPGDIVAVVMQPGLEVPIAFLAAMKAGAAFAPIDCNWPLARMQAVLQQLGASVVLLNGGLESPLSSLRPHTVHYERLGTGPDPGLALTSEAPIYVMHTSGSTGLPKGALNCHRGIVNRLCFMSRYFGDGADEVVLQTTHHCFDSAIWQFFWPMIKGGCCVLPGFSNSFELAEIVRLMTAHRVTLSDFSPALLSVFADHLAVAPALQEQLRLRHLVVGGEEFTPAIARKCANVLPQVGLHNFYGVSEASIGCIHYRIPATQHGSVPIGRPIDNVVVMLADPQLRPVPVGAAGEILLGGDCVGIGYVGLPEKTRSVFVELSEPLFGCRRWYRTGDLGRYRQDGELEFLGRIDAQVKLRGFRIELGEVRAALEQLAAVRMAHVQVNGEQERRQLVAYLVPHPGSDAGELAAVARRTLAQVLPDYMLPAAYHVIDDLPLSPSGKVNRRALAELTPAPAPTRAVRGPLNGIERELAQIWAGVLQVPEESLSVTDSFFEIGGHSLLCIAVQAGIRKRLGREVAIADLFLYPTIGHLAGFLGGAVEVETERTAVLLDAKDRMRRARKK